MRYRYVRHDSPLSTAVFTLGAGSLSDPKGQEGISHYLEHVLLDASDEYPDEKSVSDAFAKLGASTNGGTGFDSVCYYGTCRAANLAEMVKVHCGLISSPLLRDEDIERERKIVLSELKDGLDDAMDVFFYAVADGALGWSPIIGHEGTVSAITAEQIREHHARHHGMSNLTVTVCGPSSAEDEIRRLLSGFAQAVEPSPPPPTINLADLGLVKPQFGQACLAVVAPGAPGMAAPFRENLIAAAASNCVGGTDFSMLFRRLRGELGLAYWIGVNAIRWRDAGTTCVMSQFDPALMGQVKQEISEVLHRAVDSGVPDETVGFARDAMLTSAAARCETTAGLAQWFEAYHIAGAFGVPGGYDEYEKLLCGITKADVDAYVATAFAPMLDGDACKTVTMTPS